MALIPYLVAATGLVLLIAGPFVSPRLTHHRGRARHVAVSLAGAAMLYLAGVLQVSFR